MAEFRINIRLEGQALRDHPDHEVADMLIKMAGQIRANRPIGDGMLLQANSLFDSNGNRVGQVKVHVEEE